MARELQRIDVPRRSPVRHSVLYGAGVQNLALLEPAVFAALAAFTIRPGAFVDVGVNLGQTLLKAKALDWERPYYGFEVNPRCCWYVDELIRVNRIPQCTLIPAGLSDSGGLRVLTRRTQVDLDPTATIVAENLAGKSRGREFVHTPIRCRGARRRSDPDARARVDFRDQNRRRRRGARVLRGLQATVARFRPFVICEMLPTERTGTALALVAICLSAFDLPSDEACALLPSAFEAAASRAHVQSMAVVSCALSGRANRHDAFRC